MKWAGPTWLSVLAHDVAEQAKIETVADWRLPADGDLPGGGQASHDDPQEQA
jgi:hypothetical protein